MHVNKQCIFAKKRIRMRTKWNNKFCILCMVASYLLVSIHADAQINKTSVAQKGDFNLGLTIGTPRIKGWNAVMPVISTDASWIVLSEFIDTKTFGKNGSVDVGVYYGFSAYKQDNLLGIDGENQLLYHSALIRSAFHFQFVDKLDTYAGIMSGANIRSYSNNSLTNDVSFAYNLYAGAKYYFSPKFAIKLECIEDFTPWLSAGVSFKF
ncbi:hypothetical protein EZS27_037573 [termite gut metagenome]|uniref:Outer membrane protein beta-barrel domain-containing protein n=1 Tax=termite gut metagenome TaxID=433724 RepID=A0A5J4PRS5_9ZZZZ